MVFKCESCISVWFLSSFVTRTSDFMRTKDFQAVAFHKQPKPHSASGKSSLRLRTAWISWPLTFDIVLISILCIFDCHISTPFVETQSICYDDFPIEKYILLWAFSYSHNQDSFHLDNRFILAEMILFADILNVTSDCHLYAWNGASIYSKMGFLLWCFDILQNGISLPPSYSEPPFSRRLSNPSFFA